VVWRTDAASCDAHCAAAPVRQRRHAELSGDAGGVAAAFTALQTFRHQESIMQTARNPQDLSANGQDVALPSSASGNVAASTGIASEFHNFVADVEDLLIATTSLTGDDLTRARELLQARIAAAKQSIETTGHAIAGRARRGAQATDTYVHQQPWQAIGIGALVGLTVGYLAGRRT
jgi:ElaB/YqjD/DUF883 family membrane-anchored ribosome-binding protein